MDSVPVIAVFDIGKTNKKLFLFDEDYKILHQYSTQLAESFDDDGFPCENLTSLRSFIFDALADVAGMDQFNIRAVNISAYGASLVHLDSECSPVGPLYNYLKPFPCELGAEFYAKYGGEERFSMETASPVLGNLNSGLQLYRLKKEKPLFLKRIKHSIHLPQYISNMLTGKVYSDITSIGCHTGLWNFEKNHYHNWIQREELLNLLAPLQPANKVFPPLFPGIHYSIGIGLHDSSAALIPYLVSFTEPFVLLSTGTWSISLNPFDHTPLTAEELRNDCLNYLQYKGLPVKASRLFAGYEYEQQVKRIADHFHSDLNKYHTMEFDLNIIAKLESNHDGAFEETIVNAIAFSKRDLSLFTNDKEAYHHLMLDIIEQQKASTSLVLKGAKVKRIFVDGGFSKNIVFMHLLATAFPDMEVFAASMAQATAVGAALAIHSAWNSKPQPTDLIELKYYSAKQNTAI
ncbi:MAG: carbohydrate kinase [Sphingobacteriaceae bacterium]|nr:MAG: carbohydrate kinase [Sphingobacteriaceae bacterium]